MFYLKKFYSILLIYSITLTCVMFSFGSDNNSSKGIPLNLLGYPVQITSIETNNNKTIIRLNVTTKLPKTYMIKIYIEDKNNQKTIFYVNKSNIHHETCGNQQCFFILNKQQETDFLKLKCNPTFKYAIRMFDMCIDVN